MSNKTLSTGTLSLRFMQNALRRQQLQEVELERAEVKDEGKWEVGRDIKEAWGIGPGTRQDDSVVYESSYLPFLFSSEHEDATSHVSKPLGRRTFDKKGQDVSHPQQQLQTQQANDSDDGELVDDEGLDTGANGDATPSSSQTPKQDGQLTRGRKFKVHAKPRAISSAFGSNLKGFDTFDRPTKDGQRSLTGAKRKSAREAIFDSLNGVGTDLRSAGDALEDREASEIDEATVEGQSKQKWKQEQREKQQQRENVASTGFLKPAGVDEPASRKTGPYSGSGENPTKSVSHDIIDGARKKRLRDSGDRSDEGKKKSKKKRSILSKGLTGSQ